MSTGAKRAAMPWIRVASGGRRVDPADAKEVQKSRHATTRRIGVSGNG
jgi:hypothetical protein